MKKLLFLLMMFLSFSAFPQTKNIVPNVGHQGSIGTSANNLYWLNVFTDYVNGYMPGNWRLKSDHDSLSFLKERKYQSLTDTLTWGPGLVQSGHVTKLDTANASVLSRQRAANTYVVKSVVLNNIQDSLNNRLSANAIKFNGITLTPLSIGFTLAGGTSPKILTVDADATVSGMNSGDGAFNPNAVTNQYPAKLAQQTAKFWISDTIKTSGKIIAGGTIAGSNLSGTNTGDNAVNSLYSGLVTFPGFGATAATAAVGNDSRLSDARAPTSHTHGNITNAGAIGSTTALPIITTTSGVLTAGSWGTASGTFAQGNDSRLSDARVSNIAASTSGNVMTSNGTLWTSTAIPTHTGDVTGATALTIASDAVTYAKQGAEFKGDLTITGGTAIDWASGMYKSITLSGNTTYTYTNLEKGKTIILKMSGSYIPYFPTGTSIINGGTYTGAKVNYLILTCVDTSAPLILMSVNTMP